MNKHISNMSSTHQRPGEALYNVLFLQRLKGFIDCGKQRVDGDGRADRLPHP